MESTHQTSTQPLLLWVSASPPSVGPTTDATSIEVSSEIASMGWRVILTATGSNGYSRLSNVDVYSFKIPEVYLLRQIIFHYHLYRLTARFWKELDVVIFRQMSAPWLIPLRLIRTLFNMPKPLFVMDTRTIHMIPKGRETIKDRIRGTAWKIFEAIGNRWADGRLSITMRMAQEIGIPTDKLWGVWPSGVKLDLFKSTHSARVWPRKGQPVRLIYVGVLNPERNLMELCRAVEKANTELMKFEFWIIGDGLEREDLQKFAERTSGRIKVFKTVPHDLIPNLLADSHIGTLPFPDEISFQVSSPIKLFEYLGAGMPVLATRIVCHTDVIGAEDCVFWAETSDAAGLLSALRHAWQKHEDLEKMGAISSLIAQQWSWRESAKKLAKALEYGVEKNSLQRSGYQTKWRIL